MQLEQVSGYRTILLIAVKKIVLCSAAICTSQRGVISTGLVSLVMGIEHVMNLRMLFCSETRTADNQYVLYLIAVCGCIQLHCMQCKVGPHAVEFQLNNFGINDNCAYRS